jgi:hypothetical protein
MDVNEAAGTGSKDEAAAGAGATAGSVASDDCPGLNGPVGFEGSVESVMGRSPSRDEKAVAHGHSMRRIASDS